MALTLPTGARSAGVACGIKKEGLDLGLLAFEHPVIWAGTFTTNAAAAAPVGWCRERLGTPVRALVVNSGNANACTGSEGVEAVRATAESAAAGLGCSPDEVLVASTGPIGVQLPVKRIVDGLAEAVGRLDGDAGSFAASILTTDTHIKAAQREVEGGSIMGVAKGAAMIAPNMATMLAFLVTDVAVPEDDLQRYLSLAVDRSFCRISVDACESTNDSVFLMSTGSVPPGPGFYDALEEVCAELAEQIVRDAEGGTKLMRIGVTGARDESAAVGIARAVADSALWKSAVGGSDPNWGRVLAAAGGADRDLDLGAVVLAIGGVPVFDAGEPVDGSAEAAQAMLSDEVLVSISVGKGPGAATFLTCDLTEAYVTLNAGGLS